MALAAPGVTLSIPLNCMCISQCRGSAGKDKAGRSQNRHRSSSRRLSLPISRHDHEDVDMARGTENGYSFLSDVGDTSSGFLWLAFPTLVNLQIPMPGPSKPHLTCEQHVLFQRCTEQHVILAHEPHIVFTNHTIPSPILRSQCGPAYCHTPEALQWQRAKGDIPTLRTDVNKAQTPACPEAITYFSACPLCHLTLPHPAPQIPSQPVQCPPYPAGRIRPPSHPIFPSNTNPQSPRPGPIRATLLIRNAVPRV